MSVPTSRAKSWYVIGNRHLLVHGRVHAAEDQMAWIRAHPIDAPVVVVHKSQSLLCIGTPDCWMHGEVMRGTWTQALEVFEAYERMLR